MPTPARHADFAAFYERHVGPRLRVRLRRDRRRRGGRGPGGVRNEPGRGGSVSADYDEPAGWVRQVATREAIRRWRRARTALLHGLSQRRPEPHPPPDENSVVLVEALGRLPAPQRRALVLHHLAGLPVVEAARVERCPTGTVKARLSRGRSGLAALLGEATTGRPGPVHPDHPRTDQETRHA